MLYCAVESPPCLSRYREATISEWPLANGSVKINRRLCTYQQYVPLYLFNWIPWSYDMNYSIALEICKEDLLKIFKIATCREHQLQVAVCVCVCGWVGRGGGARQDAFSCSLVYALGTQNRT